MFTVYGVTFAGNHFHYVYTNLMNSKHSNPKIYLKKKTVWLNLK